MHRFAAILCLNILGVLLFFSWYLPANHGFWFTLDSSIFMYFNHLMVRSHAFAILLAITNYRAFDLISLLAMGAMYYVYFRRADRRGKYRLISIGIVMLLSAVVINQLGHLIPVSHASPTLFFQHDPNVVRIAQLVSIPTKDASSNSFPGDHGMMLMIFAMYMWRYFGLRAFLGGVLIVVVFSLPRVMIGAHWFTDIAVGSLSVLLVGLSWWMLTGACDWLIGWLNLHLPGSPEKRAQ
ncbi:phosphatase PAP2 family protein [Martelella alba]|uniref:Phosphatase PAP2 family protein n=1 Tax=Martelella alba TaxID=2590451 RepID=A0ABY2SL45_9HYPH|nr:phosphatase PAP2 family protein [Martelella alba]TKI05828.1 phosphatase PAP2 family protein [Martelella alba]